mmetsp:Transcript_92639/g.146460  ORF Transcript_92639/g.146460 Transcript_92639/m.146460 type:complete len:202 (-) Transcript_92639:270-875(-)
MPCSRIVLSVSFDFCCEGILRILILWSAILRTHVFSCVLVQLHQFGDVELWLLQNFDFSDENILQRVYSLSVLFDLLADRLRNQFLHQLTKLHLASFRIDDIDHLPSNFTDLSRLSIAIRLFLIVATLCESDYEKPNYITISGLDIGMCFNQRVPLPNHRGELVTSKTHSMKVGEAVLALHVFNAKLNLLECQIVICIEIS